MATLVEIHDRVKFTGSCTGGTGTLSFNTAVAGFRTPANAASAEANWWPFLIHDESNDEWEVGLYFEQTNFNTSWGRSGDQIVLASSNSGSAVNFTNTTADSVTVSLVDPAAFVNAGPTYIYAPGLSPSLDAVVRLTGATQPAAAYTMPLLQFPDNGVDGYLGPSATSHVERGMKRLTTTDATTTTVATIKIPTSGKNLVYTKATFLVQSGTDSQVVEGKIVAHYDGTTQELIGTPVFTVVEEDSGLNTVAYSVVVGGGEFAIQVTGLAATTIEWVVALETTFAEI